MRVGMSHGAGRSLTGAALAVALLGCSSGGYVEGERPDLAMRRRDGATADAHLLTDGLMPPADATTLADATTVADMAWAPNTWTSFGQSFAGGTGICQEVNSGSVYFLTTSVAEMPYHCQVAVDFPTKPTADAVYKISSDNPPGPPGTAYALILDYRTGSFETWHSLDSGEVAVKIVGSSIWIELRSALLHESMGSVPDQPVSGMIVCP